MGGGLGKSDCLRGGLRRLFGAGLLSMYPLPMIEENSVYSEPGKGLTPKGARQDEASPPNLLFLLTEVKFLSRGGKERK